MRIIKLLMAFGLLLQGAAYADPIMEISTRAEREVVVTAADGTETTTLEAVVSAVPGEVIVYTLSYQNSGDAPAPDVVINDPIPANVSYQMGSAFGAGADIVGSADGGLSWGPLSSLTVAGDDGQPRAATGADITHLRFVLRNPVPAGGRGFVRFKVVVQ